MTKATISVLGIDLGKNTCSMAGLDITGAVVLRRKVTRDGLIAFAKGRDLAAWLGLTPRQHSTGGKTKMLGISKRENRYLRK
jgi:transposase